MGEYSKTDQGAVLLLYCVCLDFQIAFIEATTRHAVSIFVKLILLDSPIGDF